MKGYYFITDSDLSRAGNISDVMQAAACGVEVVQYRNKKAETRQMYEEALLLKELCRDLTFLINDRIDIALAVDADGVHLGQSDMPCTTARKLLGREKIIGVTAGSRLSGGLADIQDCDQTRCRKASGHNFNRRDSPGCQYSAHRHWRDQSLQCSCCGPGRSGRLVCYILRRRQ